MISNPEPPHSYGATIQDLAAGSSERAGTYLSDNQIPLKVFCLLAKNLILEGPLASMTNDSEIELEIVVENFDCDVNILKGLYFNS